MKDIQNQVDHRRIDIKKVGVKTITYPITVLDRAQRRQETIATINMYVNLPHRFKGTHMSRFIEILNRFHGRIDITNFRLILEEMKNKLDAEAAHVEMAFPFFLEQPSGKDELQLRRYQCAMHCRLEEEDDFMLHIKVPIARPFSEYLTHESGAFGLWGNVDISVKFDKFMWIEDLIDIVEETIRHDDECATTHECDGDLSTKKILERLAERFNRLTELRWYSLTVENMSKGYSLFAALNSEVQAPDIPEKL